MVDEELRRRAKAAPVARLATVDAAGRPRVVPCCFALDGDVIYSAVDHKPKRTSRLARLDDIRGNPAVCLVVDHYEDDWSKLWWVRLDGTARVVEDGPERQRGVELLVAKYRQYQERRPTGPVIVITVAQSRSWSSS
ncbi:MAG: TIGR03668 family PPOX class F420-dependent oxidoreductase [Actinomycetota bacterium]|nr:TIGR03668 family PPOX class F420-dependent oxidoreductase [Actinomycetota bacterium]